MRRRWRPHRSMRFDRPDPPSYPFQSESDFRPYVFCPTAGQVRVHQRRESMQFLKRQLSTDFHGKLRYVLADILAASFARRGDPRRKLSFPARAFHLYEDILSFRSTDEILANLSV